MWGWFGVFSISNAFSPLCGTAAEQSWLGEPREVWAIWILIPPNGSSSCFKSFGDSGWDFQRNPRVLNTCLPQAFHESSDFSFSRVFPWCYREGKARLGLHRVNGHRRDAGVFFQGIFGGIFSQVFHICAVISWCVPEWRHFPIPGLGEKSLIPTGTILDRPHWVLPDILIDIFLIKAHRTIPLLIPSWKILPRFIPSFLPPPSSFSIPLTPSQTCEGWSATILQKKNQKKTDRKNIRHVLPQWETRAGTLRLKTAIIDFSISLAFNVLGSGVNTTEPFKPRCVLPSLQANRPWQGAP